MELVDAKLMAELEEPFEGDAWALLASVYKDKRQSINLRVDAAKAAISYEKPRLNTIDTRVWLLELISPIGYFTVMIWFAVRCGESFWKFIRGRY